MNLPVFVEQHRGVIERALSAAWLLWLAASLVVLLYWAVSSRIGWRAMKARPVRENFLQLPTLLFVFAGFLIINFGLATVLRALGVAGRIDPAATQPTDAMVRSYLWGTMAQVGTQAALVALILPLAASAFVNGLRGFGLRFRRAGRDVLFGLVCLAVVFPLVMLVLFGTAFVFRWLGWPVTEHSVFQMIRRTGDPRLIALGLTTAVVAAPVAEEVFFRGLIQSFLVRFLRVMMPPKGFPMMALWVKPPEIRMMEAEAAEARTRAENGVRNLLREAPCGPTGKRFPTPFSAPPDPASLGGQAEPLSPDQEARRAIAAVVLASLGFAAVHLAVPASVPAIFVLALALGYAYERTGSLLTCIAMHMGFNALNMLMFHLQTVLRP